MITEEWATEASTQIAKLRDDVYKYKALAETLYRCTDDICKSCKELYERMMDDEW